MPHALVDPILETGFVQIEDECRGFSIDQPRKLIEVRLDIVPVAFSSSLLHWNSLNAPQFRVKPNLSSQRRGCQVHSASGGQEFEQIIRCGGIPRAEAFEDESTEMIPVFFVYRDRPPGDFPVGEHPLAVRCDRAFRYAKMIPI
jgi:hypothetical protein